MGKRGRWQVGGNTNPSAAGGIGRLDRRCVSRPAAMFLCGVASCAIIAFSSPATAQVSLDGTVALPGNAAITGMGVSNLVTGAPAPLNNLTLDGQGGQGFFVTSGSTLQISNSVLQNFITTGGSGS